MAEISIDQTLDTLEKFSKFLSRPQIKRLYAIYKSLPSIAADLEDLTNMEYAERRADMAVEILRTSQSMDPVSDIMSEVQELINFSRAVRIRVIDKGDKATPREIKDVIQSASSLYTMMTKLQEDIVNQTRLRNIEAATIETIKTLKPDEQAKFFKRLEEKLNE